MLTREQIEAVAKLPDRIQNYGMAVRHLRKGFGLRVDTREETRDAVVYPRGTRVTLERLGREQLDGYSFVGTVHERLMSFRAPQLDFSKVEWLRPCEHEGCDKGNYCYGYHPAEYVTRDMAFDAGDPSLEGTLYREAEYEWGACPCCDGDYKECKRCGERVSGIGKAINDN